MMTDHRKIRYFSLVEMIVVVAIIMLAVGVVMPKLGEMPAFIQLDDAINRIKTVFLEASNRALIQGKSVQVELKGQSLSIVSSKDKKKNDGLAAFKQYFSYEVPKDIKVSVEKYEREDGASIWDEELEDDEDDEEDDEEDVKRLGGIFTFYADGSASGPVINLEFNDEKTKLVISPLTGVVNIISENNEEGEIDE